MRAVWNKIGPPDRVPIKTLADRHVNLRLMLLVMDRTWGRVGQQSQVRVLRWGTHSGPKDILEDLGL